MTFDIEGEHNTATVHTNTPREECEDEALEQIQEMVNHEAFVGENDVEIMPDFHWGAGAVIGFTMPVKDRVVPNTIGVDIGCGMYAVKLNIPDFDREESTLSAIDTAIRNNVPTGFDVRSDSDYHVVNDFPYTTCEHKWDLFNEATDFDLDTDEPPKYPRDDYFTDLCRKVGYDIGRGINSIGSLGGGNHFIELGTDERGDVWCIIHSGSRGLGAAVAEYWQNQATARTTERKTLDDVPESVRKYMENWKPKADKIRSEFEGEEIQKKFDEVSQAIQEYGPSTSDRNTDLDYLEGEEAHGYIKDMIFAQTYASESRKEMAYAVREALAAVFGRAQIVDSIESVHNYIDFDDGMIRKGATSAHADERLVVPFNMSYGTIIVRGRGKESWNNSSAHGAGRAMSRSAAHDTFDESDFETQTDGVYMSKTPMDEIPGAYKPAEQIEDVLGDSVRVETRVKPFLSIKAE